MSYEVVTESGLQIMDCGGVMDITDAVELHARLLILLESKQPVLLDASRVERTDTAALQVLSAFIQDANSQQQEVKWKKPSEALTRSAELLGLSSLLKISTSQGG